MKNIKIFTLLLSLLVFIGSCDNDFEEMNQDPNNATNVESGLLIADVVRLAGNQLYSTFAGGDMGSCWSQQWAKVQYNDEERYSPRASVISGFWDTFYEDVVSDSKTMQDLAIIEENSNMEGVALILQAYGYSVLTDVYGDVPFAEAMKANEGILKPAYSPQSEIYAGLLTMLDEADSKLSAGGGDINAGSDLIYSGDYMKWKKFANSLKFRILMRMSGVQDVSAQLQEIVSSKAVFTSNSDDAKLVYLGEFPNGNPIYETIVYGTRNEFKVSNVLVQLLDDNNDPRLEVYAQPNADGEYRGKPAGIFDVPSEEWNYENVSPVGELYLEGAAPAYFMSYAELQFLMAEAAIKGYITGDAQTYHSNGIAASMAANGISDYTGTVGLILPANTNAALRTIGEQNWLALYCQGIEAWTEQRRTGYPVLTPAIDGTISEIPSRFFYPNTEQSLNAESYDAAIARQGADQLTTKVWWNK